MKPKMFQKYFYLSRQKDGKQAVEDRSFNAEVSIKYLEYFITVTFHIEKLSSVSLLHYIHEYTSCFQNRIFLFTYLLSYYLFLDS